MMSFPKGTEKQWVMETSVSGFRGLRLRYLEMQQGNFDKSHQTFQSFSSAHSG